MSSLTSNHVPELQWERLADLPDQHGFAGAFGGFHGDTLIVAGGANFSEQPLWEGGSRIWHDRVFIWREEQGWRVAGRLPGPIFGYGASVETNEGVICIGGSSAEGHFAEVFRLEFRNDGIHTTAFPSLPQPVASAAAALVGEVIYVAGGHSSPDARDVLHKFWKLELNAVSEGWQELEAWPGPERMLAVAGTNDREFYLFSGVQLRPGETVFERINYLDDAYRYHPETGWSRLANLPRGAAAAASPVPFVNRKFVVSGGVDGSHLGLDPRELPALPSDILIYDPRVDRWSKAGETPAPHVVLPVATNGGAFYFPSGESSPGVRTPAVWRLRKSAVLH